MGSCSSKAFVATDETILENIKYAYLKFSQRKEEMISYKIGEEKIRREKFGESDAEIQLHCRDINEKVEKISIEIDGFLKQIEFYKIRISEKK
jgi:hypothetical protein